MTPSRGKTGAMATGRRWLIVIGLITAILVGSGLWRRAQLIDERAHARTERVRALRDLTALQRGLATATRAIGAVEANTAAARGTTVELVASAETLVAQIRVVERARDDAALAAFVANGQVGRMRECLDGINRALNEVTVGDPKGVATLVSVRASCRAVGA